MLVDRGGYSVQNSTDKRKTGAIRRDIARAAAQRTMVRRRAPPKWNPKFVTIICRNKKRCAC